MVSRKKAAKIKYPKWEIYHHKNGFERVLGYSNASFKALYEGTSYDLNNVASAVYGPRGVCLVNTARTRYFRAHAKKFCTPVKTDYVSFRAFKQP